MKRSIILLASLLLMVFSAVALAGDLVNINTADRETLSNELRGIGPGKAKAIVKYREEIGGFKTVDQLIEVSGIGEKTLARIRDRITVDEKTDSSE